MIIWSMDFLPELEKEAFALWFDLQMQAAKAEERAACVAIAEEEERAFDRIREFDMANGAATVTKKLRSRT